MIKLYNDDCLNILKTIETDSIDMILQDPPYNTTNCEWDEDILNRIDDFWFEWKRVIKQNGVIIMTAQQPFTTRLISSNYEWFKYCLYWQKEKPTNFFQLKRRFGKTVEEIIIFYNKQPTYNPQMIEFTGKKVKNSPKGTHKSIVSGINSKTVLPYNDTGFRFPTDLIRINRDKLGTTIHPTQKPVALFELLIKSFSNEGDLIFDGFMGSGSSAIASNNLNRNYIGCELNRKHFDDAKLRIENER